MITRGIVLEPDESVEERGMVVMRSTCPVCNHGGMEVIVLPMHIPYLGEVIENTVHCRECGFRHSDVQVVSQHGPMHCELTVKGAGDMSVRVVRSSSATVRIPELGVLIEPGPASEGYVSNVEGILNRVLDALDVLLGDNKGNRKAAEIKAEVEKVKAGRKTITLIIDDPFGNSTIISERANKRPLTREELSALRFGEAIMSIEGDA